MPQGRPKPALLLTAPERAALEGRVRAGRSSQAMAERALIVLACAEGGTNASVALRLGLTPQTVGKWRTRFVTERLPGLDDPPRSGRPPSLLAGSVEWLLALTLFARPRSAPRWSARSMGEECGMSQSRVLRIWRGFGLRPSSIAPASDRTEARALVGFQSLLGLLLDARTRGRVRTHCVESTPALRAYLSGRSGEGPPRELVLFECGGASEAYARDWQSTRSRFSLHVAPRGSLWFPTFSPYFVQEPSADLSASIAAVSEQVVGAMASGDGFEGGAAAYAFSAAGEKALRGAARLL